MPGGVYKSFRAPLREVKRSTEAFELVNAMPEQFHHFIVVPSGRPKAIQTFLSRYLKHANTFHPDAAKRIHFIIVNGASGTARRRLDVVLRRISNRHNNIHPVGNRWLQRLITGCHEEGVPQDVLDYLTEKSYSQLRNVGQLAARSLAQELELDPKNVLVHQLDDDVLPAYTLAGEPERLHPLAFSVFSSAEAAFRQGKTAALLGQYSGAADEPIPEIFSRMAGNKGEAFVLPTRWLNDPLKTRKTLESLSSGIHPRLQLHWTEEPREGQFSFSEPRYDSRYAKGYGGSRVIRLDRIAPIPPTPFRGEDLFQVAELFKRNPEGIREARQRQLHHAKHPSLRDFAKAAASDFWHEVLVRVSPRFRTVTGERGVDLDDRQAVAAVIQRHASDTLNRIPFWTEDLSRPSLAAKDNPLMHWLGAGHKLTRRAELEGGNGPWADANRAHDAFRSGYEELVEFLKRAAQGEHSLVENFMQQAKQFDERYVLLNVNENVLLKVARETPLK